MDAFLLLPQSITRMSVRLNWGESGYGDYLINRHAPSSCADWSIADPTFLTHYVSLPTVDNVCNYIFPSTDHEFYSRYSRDHRHTDSDWWSAIPSQTG